MAEKKAVTQVPIHTLLARRWSPRAFDPERVLQPAQLVALLEAARWAPSCGGGQPWRIVVCQRNLHTDIWPQVLESLDPGNREWAQHAALLFVVAADEIWHAKQKPNRWGQYDTGAAAENICLQATAIGAAAHQMGGFDAQVLAATLDIPQHCTLMSVIAVGWPLPQALVPEAWRARENAPRARNPMDDNFFLGRWGTSVSPHLPPLRAADAPPPDDTTGKCPFKPLHIAVLTVSDRRAEAQDQSGTLLCGRLQESGHHLYEHRMTRDEIHEVRAVVAVWIAAPEVDVIISTGGTGVTGRDGTPEAVTVLFDKTLDGFGEAFRHISATSVKTSSIQSRALAGVANGTYIFTLPGSRHACATAWDEIISAQLDYRTTPCNLVQLMPRLKEC